MKTIRYRVHQKNDLANCGKQWQGGEMRRGGGSPRLGKEKSNYAFLLQIEQV